MFRKKTDLVFYGLWLVSFALILFSSLGETRKVSGDSGSDAALAALTGMGSAPPRTSGGGSIFDSDFWRAGARTAIPEDQGGQKDSGEEPEILEKASEGNPVNPQNGLPYTDVQMAQFEKLREQFPNNSLIPKRLTPELQQQQEEERKRINSIREKMGSKQASAGEISDFYDNQAKGMKDRTELLEYVLGKVSDELDADMKKKYEEVLASNKQAISRIEEEKKKAMEQAR